MAVDERRRSELYRAAVAALGEEPAATMFELMPPADTDLATRRDIESIDQRFDAIDQRFDAVDQRFDAIEQHLDAKLDAVRNELLAAFRGELVSAVAGQTRAVIVATATAVFGIGGLAVALAQLL